MKKKKNIQYSKGGLQKNNYSNMDELTFWSCPLCGSKEEKRIKNERGKLKVVKCTKCSLIRINPRLKNPDSIYCGDINKYEREFKLIISGDLPHHRDKNYLADLNIIKKFKPAGEFLDIGTNTGSFLRLARNQDWNLTGVEPSKSLAELARKFWGLNIINQFLEKADLKSEHFDIVTMTDVFEHVVTPLELLSEIKRIIKKDGILLIKVPNAKFNELKYYVRSHLLGQKESDDFDAYEHVCHYTDVTLKSMLTKSGFKILKIIIDLPVQLPAWHKYVGEYYQYPSPFFLDWRSHLGRTACYYFSKIEYLFRAEIGYFAPTITCITSPD